jgi:hypothetical protein
MAQEMWQNCSTEQEKLSKIIKYTESRFVYKPGKSEGKYPDVICDIARGNCLDMNTIFLSLLYFAEIKSAYNIGYFFEKGHLVADGMHCWICTVVDGKNQNWDIGHHLARALGATQDSLNPVLGLRCTMTRGRGLQFEIKEMVTQPICHFVYPLRVNEKGESQPMRVRATLLDV